MSKSLSLFIAVLLVIAGCTSKEKKKGFYFKNLPASQTGVDFENTITESDSLNLFVHEYIYMGGGVGIGDFNNDGLQDVFFSANQQSSKLYLNKGDMHFDDITSKADLKTQGWCTGVSIVDINQDGWQDIYVCVSGIVAPEKRKNLLFINQHDLTFKEQAGEYGLADTSYSTQAAFFDYDKDGDLDMYLENLLLKGATRNTIVTVMTQGHSPMSDVLYRNNGIPAGMDHPVFSNVTTEAGIFDNAYGLGLSISDLNGDLYPDIYTANDYLSNDQLWLNNKNGTFTNCIASALRHQSYSSMGTDIADYNNDGLPDIASLDMQPETNERKKMMFAFLTDVRFKMERDAGYEPQFIRNMLHLNNGVRNIQQRKEPFFSEIGQMAGMSETDWSWSVLMADFDNDGWKDMHITNGMGRDLINADFVLYRQNPSFKPDETDGKSQLKSLLTRLESLGSVPLRNYFYRNKGDLIFEDFSTQAGITEKTISNGAAYADLDNDGDLDLVINNIDSKATILQNELNSKGKESLDKHFITLEFKGNPLNREGIGTKVNFYSPLGNQFFEQYPVRGYLSSVDQRIHIGFGKQLPDSIVITWPDDKQQNIVHPPVDTMLVIKQSDAKSKISTAIDSSVTLFTDITSQLNLPYRHNESFFYDYGIQSLLPQKFSQEGPFISTGDLNGDGLEDFFVGGAYKQSGKIFLQQPNGNFRGTDLVKGEKNEEDMQSLLFDADGDKDPDLFIVSGSSQFHPNSPNNKPQLFINDGKGNFTKDSTAIPGNVFSPAKCIAGADIDGDGDTDIFIGGRVIIAAYPQSPRSFLLRNDKGKFTDITPPSLQYPGLLNAATWADIDNDKTPELILAGEWMPIRIFKNVAGNISEITESSGTKNFNGFWRSIAANDIDNDGDIDLVAGNLGMNNPYRISQQQPAKLIAKDFDGNGIVEPVFCYFIPDNNFVYKENIGIIRDQWAAQMPSIKKRYDLNQPYASATMEQIITPEEMKDAIVLTCNEVRSGYFENDGKGNFTFHPFGLQAQFAPVNTILIADAEGDGNKDVLLAGNEYEYNVTAGRMDASYGQWLKGNGKGGFSAIAPAKSGWITDGDVRDLKFINDKKWGKVMMVARNNDSLQIFRIR
jgi:hypothetical protein